MEQPLSLWEAVCLGMNVTLAFELEGPVTPEHIKQAYKAVSDEYNYLRTVMSFRSAEFAKEWFFVEVPDFQVPLQHTLDAAVHWQRHIQTMANTPRDHTRSMAWLELFTKGSRHQLFATVSHAGMDGTGLFHMFHRFFEHLGHLSKGEALCSYPQREFVELMQRIPPEAAQIPQPTVPSVYMPTLSIETARLEDSKPPRVEAVFWELDATQTSQLLTRAKAHKTSIQGIVSAASMVAIAAAQSAAHPLPQTVLVQAPTNLRKQLSPPVDMDNSFCGSSFLWWAQPMSGDETIWEVAAKATEHARRENEKKGGLGFWYHVINSVWKPAYTVQAIELTCVLMYHEDFKFGGHCTQITSSSVGVNPIQAQYGEIKIDQANMMLATYDRVDPREPVVMTHAQTFAGRLCTTFGFSLPAVGEERAHKFAALQNQIIAALAGDQGEKMTVHEAFALQV